MLLEERHNRIVHAVRVDGASTVRELAESLEVSESTIRRDLEVLDRNGELKRTYGGAVVAPGATVEENGESVEDPFAEQKDVDAGLKKRAARAAADLVSDGSVIILDIGTTTPYMARALHGRDITVITSSLAVYDELRDDPSVRLVLLGGVVRRNYRTLVGSLAQNALQQVSADMVFLTCTGVRANGHVVDNMAVEAPIKQAMIAAADRVVLLATEAKFPGSGALRICSLADVDTLITTTGAPDATVELCRNAGGKVIVT